MYSCMTQDEMASLLNISKTKYLRKENGRSKLNREEVIKIARILRLDEKQLLTFWMSDKIYEIIKTDKDLAKDANDILNEHFEDYETCVIMPNRSESYSSNDKRMSHRYHK